MRSDVRHLLCLLTKDNEVATNQLNEILIGAVGEAVGSHKSNPAVVRIRACYVKFSKELFQKVKVVSARKTQPFNEASCQGNLCHTSQAFFSLVSTNRNSGSD